MSVEKFLKNASKKYDIIVVTLQAGFKEIRKVKMDDKTSSKLIKQGIKIITATHALSGVGRGVSLKFGGISPSEIIANTLRLFSQGMKVCIEISIIAADAGAIDYESRDNRHGRNSQRRRHCRGNQTCTFT